MKYAATVALLLLMAISRIQAVSAATTSAAITAPTKGDLILVWAFRSGSVTPPSLPSGFTSIGTFTATTLCSQILGYKWSDGTETTSGTWTNASDVICHVYRGVHFIGAFAMGGAVSATITYPALTLQDTGNRSWVVGFGGDRTTAVNTAPTGMTSRTNQTQVIGSDTGAAVSSWAQQTVAGNTNTGNQACVVELRDQVTQTTGAGIPNVCGVRQTNPQLVPTSGAGTYRVPLPHISISGNTYVLAFAAATGASITVSSVKDSAGNNLNQRMLNTSFTGASGNTYGWYDINNSAAGLTYVEVTFSGSLVNPFIAATFALNNVPTSAPVDGTPTASETSSGTVHNPGAITTTAANSAVLTFGTNVDSAVIFSNQLAPGEAATLLTPDVTHGTFCEWQIKAAAGSINPAINILPDAGMGVMSIAYKAGTAGAAPTGAYVFSWMDYNNQRATTALNAQICLDTGDLGVINWCGVGDGTTTAHNAVLTIGSGGIDGAGNTWTSRGTGEWSQTSFTNDQQFLDTDAAALNKPSQGTIINGTLPFTDGGSTGSFIVIKHSGTPGCYAGNFKFNRLSASPTISPADVLTGFFPTQTDCVVLLNEDQGPGTCTTCTGGANFISQIVCETTTQNGATFGNGFMNDRAVGWGNPGSLSAITFGITNTSVADVSPVGSSAISYNGLPSRVQSAYRWRNDDGSESAATWKAAESTDVSQPVSTPIRLRTQMDSTGSDTPAEGLKLQYRKQGSTTWQTVMPEQ